MLPANFDDVREPALRSAVRWLEAKRAQVRREYAGAVKLAYDQVADGGDVTWEWPDKCGAWEMTTIKKMVKDLGMVIAFADAFSRSF